MLSFTNLLAVALAISSATIGVQAQRGRNQVKRRVQLGAFGMSNSNSNDYSHNYPTRHPTPYPTRHPTPAPTSNGDSIDVDIIVCFSGDATVEVLGKGHVAMKDLQIGELVRTHNNNGKIHESSRYEYAPIYAFGHHQPNQEANFLAMETTTMLNGTESIKSVLEITKDHLVYLVGNDAPVRTGSIKLGDQVAPSGEVVTRISSVQKAGIYAPLTTSGNLIVNGNILASSYATFMQSSNDYWSLVNGQGIISHHQGTHVVLAPYRIWCRTALLLGSSCGIPDNKEGIPEYVTSGMAFLSWMDQQSIVVQALSLAVSAVPFFGTFYLEQMVFEQSGFLGTILAIALVVTLWSGKKKKGIRA